MIDSKLIIVDGVWGSGKSTASQLLFLHMRGLGMPVRKILDEDPRHPLRAEPGADPEEVAAWLVEQWRDLAEEIRRGDEVVFCESVLFHLVANQLFTLGLPNKRIRQVAEEVEEIISDLSPALIYFHQKDTAAAWRTVREWRGEDWGRFMLKYVPTRYVASTVSHADMVTYLNDLKLLFQDLFSGFGFRKIAVETAEERWDAYLEEVARFLSLPHIDPGKISPEAYIGRYRLSDPPREAEITLVGKRLFVEGMFGPRKSLVVDFFAVDHLPVQDGTATFLVTGMPVLMVAFARADSGRAEGMTVTNEYPDPTEPRGRSGLIGVPWTRADAKTPATERKSPRMPS